MANYSCKFFIPLGIKLVYSTRNKLVYFRRNQTCLFQRTNSAIFQYSILLNHCQYLASILIYGQGVFKMGR